MAFVFPRLLLICQLTMTVMIDWNYLCEKMTQRKWLSWLLFFIQHHSLVIVDLFTPYQFVVVATPLPLALWYNSISCFCLFCLDFCVTFVLARFLVELQLSSLEHMVLLVCKCSVLLLCLNLDCFYFLQKSCGTYMSAQNQGEFNWWGREGYVGLSLYNPISNERHYCNIIR